MKSTRSPLLSALFVSFLLFPCSSADAAIRAAFGLSIDEFYAEFEAYRHEHFPPLP